MGATTRETAKTRDRALRRGLCPICDAKVTPSNGDRVWCKRCYVGWQLPRVRAVAKESA